MKILVTGGAGFIGSFIVDRLVDAGHEVTIYDNLDPQVHTDGKAPDYLNNDARFVLGDVRDYGALEEVVRSSEVIFHKAAAVGVGQSQYEIRHYVQANTLGTANLLDILVCPVCKGPLIYRKTEGELICKPDRLAYPIRDDIPVMLESEARQLAADEKL